MKVHFDESFQLRHVKVFAVATEQHDACAIAILFGEKLLKPLMVAFMSAFNTNAGVDDPLQFGHVNVQAVHIELHHLGCAFDDDFEGTSAFCTFAFRAFATWTVTAKYDLF